jgi:predicted PurR-regulated permease PerM
MGITQRVQVNCYCDGLMEKSAMATQDVDVTRRWIHRALEVSIQVGLAALLVVGCLMILRPFLPLLLWGVIIAIASYPAYAKLERSFKGRGIWAAIVWTLVLLAWLIIPIMLVGKNLIEGLQPLIAQAMAGTLALPAPPAGVESWPLIGGPLFRAWSRASTDLSATLANFSPQIKAALPNILSGSAYVGSTLLQFLLSIAVSGAILANAKAAAAATRAMMIRLFGEQGPEYQQLVGATIRSVTFGILGVAVIQTVFAALGFFVMGLPGASVWTIVFLFAAILQIGMVVLLPAILFAFMVGSKTAAILFLVWCIFVGLMDNVLKPLLLGRGSATPVLVVFLGVIGGFMAMGIIGLFVGAVVLAVGYKLFLAWIHGGVPEAALNATE